MTQASLAGARAARALLAAGVTLGPALVAAAGDAHVLDDRFEIRTVYEGVEEFVALEFAPDGRLFVAVSSGRVIVIEDGVRLDEPFIDLAREVNSEAQRGLLGMALDPQFLTTRHIYLSYVVDPVPGEPDEPTDIGTSCRLTRYTGTLESDGNVADPDSRLVLVGELPAAAPPACSGTHAGSAVDFGHDGSLLVSFGDGARVGPDAGGWHPSCFPPFDTLEDIGSFRAQYLGSLSGKLLRLDPATGLGLSTNPYWTGDGDEKPSKVWAYGLRQPFRFAVRPGPVANESPGAIYVCDVGRSAFEELDVALGGENFGWPCREGPEPTEGELPDLEPAHHDCDSIGGEDNPGPLTEPVVTMHHVDESRSVPPGHASFSMTGLVFYDSCFYPDEFRGLLFIADFNRQWIKTVELDEQQQLVAVSTLATNIAGVVDMTTHPLNGDVYFADRRDGLVRRIRYVAGPAGDVNGDDIVDATDLLSLFGAWGPCWGCPQDVNDDGIVDTVDLLEVMGTWG